MTGESAASAMCGRIVNSLARFPLARSVRGILREVPVWPAVIRRGRGRSVAFLPSQGREMSSLLRIHTVAESLRGVGWDTIVIPATLDLGQRQRLIAGYAPDVIVMQGGRHPLNRPNLYPGQRIVYDMDDADFHLPHLAETVRAAMGEVALVLAGSRYVADWCRAQGAPVRVVWTGTPLSGRARRHHRRRPPIIAWAQSAPIDYAGERRFVLDVMKRVAAGLPGVRLRLFGRRPGDDPAMLEAFPSAGVSVEWLPMMSYNRYLRELDDVAIGLSPIFADNPFSRGKSFGKILAYLERGVPVIASDEADHRLFFTPETGILSNDPARWAVAIDRLLHDADVRQEMADAAYMELERRLSTAAAARRIDACLRELLEGSVDCGGGRTVLRAA